MEGESDKLYVFSNLTEDLEEIELLPVEDLLYQGEGLTVEIVPPGTIGEEDNGVFEVTAGEEFLVFVIYLGQTEDLAGQSLISGDIGIVTGGDLSMYQAEVSDAIPVIERREADAPEIGTILVEGSPNLWSGGIGPSSPLAKVPSRTATVFGSYRWRDLGLDASFY